MNTLIVITHGRSGSTLLMGLLNAFDGVSIKGENNNIALPMQRLIKRLTMAKAQHQNGSTNPTHAWYGIEKADIDGFVNDLQKSFVTRVLQPEQGTKWAGYKEIRFGEDDHVKDLSEHLQFLKRLFPNVKFIFNVRNPKNTAESGWWSQRTDGIDYIEGFQSRMREAYDQFKERSLWIEYEQLVKDPQVISEISDFLGIDPDHEKIRSVLSTRHSVRPKERTNG